MAAVYDLSEVEVVQVLMALDSRKEFLEERVKAASSDELRSEYVKKLSAVEIAYSKVLKSVQL